MRLAPSRAISSSVSVISPACTEEVSVDSLSMGGVSFPPPASGVFVCWAHAEGYAALFHPIKSRDPQLLRIPHLDTHVEEHLARAMSDLPRAGTKQLPRLRHLRPELPPGRVHLDPHHPHRPLLDDFHDSTPFLGRRPDPAAFALPPTG